MFGIYKSVIVLAVALIACHADPRATRQGSFNNYHIYTRTHSRIPVTIDLNNLATAAAELSASRNTLIIVHGHGGTATTSLNPQVKDAALTTEDLDVIVVDWSVFASQSYAVASGSVPSVGLYLASLIRELVTAGVVSLNTLHLVGFDLGAHVVGFTGRELGGEVARITGLNPVGSQWGSNSQRLKYSDALYVEVLHTDGGSLLANGVGEAIAHVDIFVNGGSGQPGCFLNHTCSHNRSYEVFAATLVSSHLVANQCGNMLQVSLNTCRGYTLAIGNNQLNKLGSGIFRVNTGRTFPF